MIKLESKNNKGDSSSCRKFVLGRTFYPIIRLIQQPNSYFVAGRSHKKKKKKNVK